VTLHRKTVFTLILVLSAAMSSGSSFAHSGEVYVGGFLGGLTHPILGWDHVAAMVAVGLLGAFLGSPAIWILPVVFPLVMALGAAMGILGLPLPAVETGIAMSAVVFGLMIVFTVKPPIWISALVVGAFAVFHGYAHGTELPETANAFAFTGGFVVASGMLHMYGIACGLLASLPGGRMVVRGVGGAISLAGMAFLTSVA